MMIPRSLLRAFPMPMFTEHTEGSKRSLSVRARFGDDVAPGQQKKVKSSNPALPALLQKHPPGFSFGRLSRRPRRHQGARQALFGELVVFLTYLAPAST